MAKPETYKDVHVDRPLSNFSLAYFQNTADFVSHRFFPRINVVNASDTYDYFPSGYFNRIVDTARAEDTKANSINYRTSSKHYSVGEDAIRTFISDKKRANADSGRNLDQEATKLVTDALLLKREQMFVDTFLKTGVWTTDWAGVAATPGANQFLQWSDAASDPVKDLRKLRRDMLLAGKRQPNKMMMTLDVFDTLLDHPDILDRIKYSGSADRPMDATKRTLASLFQVDELVIMQTIVNIAADGLEDENGLPPTQDTFMANNTVLLAYVRETGGLMSPVAAATFVWNKYIGMGLDAGPAIRRYRETPAIKGEYIEAEMAMTTQVIAPDLGALLTNVIATDTTRKRTRS